MPPGDPNSQLAADQALRDRRDHRCEEQPDEKRWKKKDGELRLHQARSRWTQMLPLPTHAEQTVSAAPRNPDKKERRRQPQRRTLGKDVPPALIIAGEWSCSKLLASDRVVLASHPNVHQGEVRSLAFRINCDDPLIAFAPRFQLCRLALAIVAVALQFVGVVVVGIIRPV